MIVTMALSMALARLDTEPARPQPATAPAAEAAPVLIAGRNWVTNCSIPGHPECEEVFGDCSADLERIEELAVEAR